MTATKRERAAVLGWQVARISDSVEGEDGDVELVYYVLIPPDATAKQREWPEDHGFDTFQTESEAWDAVPIGE